MAQHPRHPDQFIEEFCRPSDKTFIEQPPIFAKDFSGICEIHIVKDGNEDRARAITGSKASITRVPPNGPADTPQIPTAL